MDRPFVLIAGAGGVVGHHLVTELLSRFDVKVLTRKLDNNEPAGTEAIQWNPQAFKEQDEAELDRLASIMSGARGIVNLAGASIGEGRLDEKHKKLVIDSRVDSTNTLVEALKRSEETPNMWFQASAVGYYGDRADEMLDESSSPQKDFFLAEVSEKWEAAAKPVEGLTRFVIGRIGLVLAKDAPAWQRMLTPIKFFAGGPLGSGQQWYPWIDADDLARAMAYLISNSSSRGVYNLSAPNPVRQIELVRAAAKQLGRPAFVPAPAFALKLLLGEVADLLLFPSARVIPKRLQEEAFVFDFATIDEEMENLL